MPPTLTIYAASAGSGKTYTLVKEYLSIALNEGLPFDKILAVTFTNDAAGEMKERIIKTLKRIAHNPSQEAMGSDLMQALKLKPAEIQERAKQLLVKILLNYDRFAVSTIDSLFLQIIRSFLLELNLGSSVQPTLDPDITFNEVALLISEKIGADEEITQALIDKALDNVRNDKRVDPLGDIIGLLNIFNNAELRQAFEQNSGIISTLSPDYWAGLVKALDTYLHQTSISLQHQVENLKNILEQAGASENDYKLKSRNVLHKIFAPDFANYKMAVGAKTPHIPYDTPGELFREKSVSHIQLANDRAFANILEQIAYLRQRLVISATLFDNIRKNLLYTRLTQRTFNALSEYKKAHQIFFISDAEELVQHLIDDSEVPFIYEKIGNRFQHIMIDEFQDTSENQWQNFKPLLENCLAAGFKCILVGDPKQSLYSWRGGKVDLLVNQVKRDFTQVFEKQTLNTNRRSLQTIIEFNNLFFKEAAPYYYERVNNVLQLKGGAAMVSTEASGSYFNEVFADVEQEVFHTAAKTGQAGYVNIELHPKAGKDEDTDDEESTITGFRRIPELLLEVQSRGFLPDDIALLIAKNKDIDIIRQSIEAYLAERPDQAQKLSIISGAAFLLKEALSVRLIIYVLTHVAFPEDKFTKANLDFHINLLKENLHTQPALLNTLNLKALLQSVAQLMLADAVEHIIQNFNLWALTDEHLYLIQFQDIVKNYSVDGSSSIYDFLEWWQSESDKQVLNGGDVKGKIKVITIHKSKGLQYPVVIMPKAEIDLTPREQNADYFPAPTQQLEAYDLDIPFPYLMLKQTAKLLGSEYANHYALYLRDFVLEKLNALYVAFTRAEKELHLLHRYKPERKKPIEEYATIGQIEVFEKWLHQGSPDMFTKHQAEGDPHKVFFRAGMPFEVHTGQTKAETTQALFVAPEPIVFMQHQIKDKPSYVSSEMQAGTTFHEEMAHVLNTFRPQFAHYKPINFEGIPPEKLNNKLVKAVYNESVFQSLISPAEDWWVEREIYAGENGFVRPDLVVIHKASAHVIDFKTGSKTEEHRHQVKQYMQLVAQILGKETKGTLIYINDDSPVTYEKITAIE